jgi:uncharacterized membrane protein
MHMRDLIAIAYPDRHTAEAVRETLTDLAAQRTIELEDAVVVTRGEEGKVKLHALILLVQKMTPDKVLPHVQRYGGEVIQTSLDDETEARLREALASEAIAAAGGPA